MPKVHSAQDLHHVSRTIYSYSQLKTTRNPTQQPLQLVASIESARALVNLSTIAGWQSEYGPSLQVSVSALLVCGFPNRISVVGTDVCSLRLKIVRGDALVS